MSRTFSTIALILLEATALAAIFANLGHFKRDGAWLGRVVHVGALTAPALVWRLYVVMDRLDISAGRMTGGRNF